VQDQWLQVGGWAAFSKVGVGSLSFATMLCSCLLCLLWS
jgi:hypothetical protein